MLSKNNKKKLFIILFSLAVFFLIASIVSIVIPKEYIKSSAPYMLLVLAAVFFVGGLVFLILFLLDKREPKSYKTPSNNMYTLTNYDKFVEWWSDCDEDEIKQNTVLLGAYQVMWLYNEVANGGYGQFFCNKEDYWNMEETTTLFQMFLTDDLYQHFLAAKDAYYKGEDTENLDRTFDYDKMDKVLNDLADKVVAILQL